MIRIILFLIILAILHAKTELMAEGKLGWGLCFPCWRINNRIINLLINKELTGYHFYMLLLFLLMFHSPFLFVDFTLKKELIIMGLFFWYWILEDFFWFLESKHYGLRNFKKGRIYWHKRWKFGLPVSYWESIIIGTILLILGGK
jgi:hypothetical protein